MTGDELTLSRYRFRILYTAPPGQVPPAENAHADDRHSPRLPLPPVLSLSRSNDSSSALPFGKLVPCGGGDPILLRRRSAVIGRHIDCDVVLRFGTISARHCQLDLKDGRWFVRDLGSRNGVRVDGKPCEEQELTPGCILSVAAQRFRVHYELPADSTPAEANRQGLLEQAGLARFVAADSENSQDQHPERWNLDTP